jgi:hypothetical protein
LHRIPLALQWFCNGGATEQPMDFPKSFVFGDPQHERREPNSQQCDYQHAESKTCDPLGP